MGLFGVSKNKEEKEKVSGCCCEGSCSQEEEKEKVSGCCCEGGCSQEEEKEKVSGCCCEGGCSQEESVKVLGSGCVKCNDLEANVKAALEQLGMDTTIEHVTDFTEIVAYGVMTTPALVVDGKVISYGKVLKVEEVVKLLQKARA